MRGTGNEWHQSDGLGGRALRGGRGTEPSRRFGVGTAVTSPCNWDLRQPAEVYQYGNFMATARLPLPSMDNSQFVAAHGPETSFSTSGRENNSRARFW